MTGVTWAGLLAFAALLLAAALQGLAASGHFPPEHRGESLRGGAGSAILFGSILLTLASTGVALVFAWRNLPWQAVIIGGGGALLAAPLALQPFPDRFVNARASLLVFAGIAGAIALAMLWHI